MPSGYLDPDVAYLLGLLVARGELQDTGDIQRIIVHFPRAALQAVGTSPPADAAREIRLGLEEVRERLLNLTGGDIRTVEGQESIDLVVRLTRPTTTWRNLQALLDHQTHFSRFPVPAPLRDPITPVEVVREFLRGFADVAGDVRPANRDWSGRHRVRLNVLNYPGTWTTPVHLCWLLQERLAVPVPNIIWGHPNLRRAWREHQLNVYADDFLTVGFSFPFKQRALEELAAFNRQRFPDRQTSPCPGERPLRGSKPLDPEEQNADRLPSALVGRHADAYWQICRALGCPRRPLPGTTPPPLPPELESEMESET